MDLNSVYKFTVSRRVCSFANMSPLSSRAEDTTGAYLAGASQRLL